VFFKSQQEPNFCKLHRQNMEVGVVSIRYGRVSHSDEYLKARRKLFPNANLYRVGGCYVSPAFPTTAKISYCAECRFVEESWWNTHCDGVSN